ncbi:site-specific DNA-methyltransferase [Candidatus Saccharibacteria bacterium]|nr:site-specific DNA-methyltransferase [Candidatus Saccharibacteria bacterium]MBQ3292704.1 site-specific DNA-methyltransferase [Candidatus Saccharibacteria bacterium]
MENTDNIERVDLEKVDWRSSREFFESLGEELDKLDDKDESYNFTWVGKRKSIIEAGTPINKTLRPDIDASKDFDNTKNMLIVGDNLDALKLLQESYLGKIKMIYIDPPYNTGHDFVYHDNFTIKKNDYEDSTTDSEGNKIISEDEFTENSKSNGRFHSDWLSMMYPRLKLARNLLCESGLIFISIDDNEQYNLKKLCDEVFGEENFVACFIIDKTAQGANQSDTFKTQHEYLFAYTRSDSSFVNSNKKAPIDKSKYKYEDKKGAYAITNSFDSINSPLSANKNRGYTIYYNEKTGDAITKDEYDKERNVFLDYDKSLLSQGYEPIRPGIRNGIQYPWNWMKSRFEEQYKEELVFQRNKLGKMAIYHKNRFNGIVKDTTIQKFDTRKSGNLLLSEMLGGKFFDYPKSVEMLKWILERTTETDGDVLDFFAGSGTTGHAVMDLNAEDGGNRKYILVQLDETTDEKSEAKKAGYDTIDQITAERLRRAGDKIIKEHPDLEGKLDTGFRVFRIDSENENTDIRKPLKDVSQIDLFNSIDNIKKDRTPLDFLFGVVYASALPFDLKLETKKIGDNTVYLYGYLDEDSGLVACFDNNISENTIKEIAKLKPLTAAFKDSSFQDSAAKINLSEQFRVIAPDTKVKVI